VLWKKVSKPNIQTSSYISGVNWLGSSKRNPLMLRAIAEAPDITPVVLTFDRRCPSVSSKRTRAGASFSITSTKVESPKSPGPKSNGPSVTSRTLTVHKRRHQ
jgi:hypothetical protein